MRQRWTRRGFLKAAAAGTLATTGAAPSIGTLSLTERRSSSSPFPANVRATLRAAMDEIIPAETGMPAASEAQVMRYLEDLSARDPSVKRDLRRAATALERRAGPGRFVSLSAARRVQALAALEKHERTVFTSLRDYVYEGYYTNPEVWERIGFEFYGPERPGPGVAAFDEKALERVRSTPPLYRKVP